MDDDAYNNFIIRQLAAPALAAKSYYDTTKDFASHVAGIPDRAFRAANPQYQTIGDWQDPADVNRKAVGESFSDLATLAMPQVSSFAAKAPGATLGVFGGLKSATADKAAWAAAHAMESAGKDPTEIWHKTGWYRGLDDVPRYEIPDKGVRVAPGYGTGVADVGSSIQAPLIAEAYPSLQWLQHSLHRTPGKTSGWFDPTQKKIFAQSHTLPELRHATLHELQHSIQDIEKFATGSSPKHEFENLVGQGYTLGTGGSPVTALTPEMRKQLSQQAFDIYQGRPGEMEARAASLRAHMSPKRLQGNPPWETMINDPRTPEAQRQWLLERYVNAPRGLEGLMGMFGGP